MVLRAIVLKNLKRYEEALASCDKAIELGAQSSYAFFNRAIALLGLNRWDEGIAALDDAFQRLEPDNQADAEDANLIISNLFASTHDAAIWKNRITSLIAVYEKAGFVCVDAVSTAEKLNKLTMFSRINPLLQHPDHLR